MIDKHTEVMELEGTWEEILARANEWAGKRVKLTVLTSAPDSKSNHEEWVKRLKGMGLPAGVSLSDEAVSRETIYE